MAALQVEKDPPGARTHAPVDQMVKVFHLAERLREEQLGSSWGPNQHVRIALIRAAVSVLCMYVFYEHGKAGVQCAEGDFIIVTPYMALFRCAVVHARASVA